MAPRIASLAVLVAAALAFVPAAHAGSKPRPTSTLLALTLKLGYTDSPSASSTTVVGSVAGEGMPEGGYRMRLVAQGTSGATGSFVYHDGTGSIKGTIVLTQVGGEDTPPLISGTQTVTGGTGRWKKATGKLEFSARLDETSVVGAQIIRALVKGKVKATPATVKPPARPRSRKVDVSGVEASIDAAGAGNTLFTAVALEGSGPAPGVLIWQKTMAGSVRGRLESTFALYTDNGILRGSGNLPAANAASRVRVTGGTARFTATRGTLTWSTVATGPRVTARLRGKLPY